MNLIFAIIYYYQVIFVIILKYCVFLLLEYPSKNTLRNTVNCKVYVTYEGDIAVSVVFFI